MLVLSEARHRGAIICHVSVDGELPTHGGSEGGVLRKEAGVVIPPHDFLLVGEIDIGVGGVFVWN
jgi:hypothetical protein